MIFAEHVKNKLSSLIHEMATAPWLFSKNPEVDFSRNRKLDFVSTIQFLLSMESGSLKKELLDYFQFSVDTPSASAFCQQRNKLLLEAFQFLFYEFNSCFSFEKKYKDYQLLACDGSDLNIARNPNDAGTYFQSQPTDRGFNQIHLNALHICRYFLRNDISPPDVETLIQKNLLPVRPGRSDPRKVKPKSAVSFLYRVA